MSAILPHMVWPYCEFRMQVWNMLHVARWKYRTQKIAIWAPSHNFDGKGKQEYLYSAFLQLYAQSAQAFATKAHIDNRKKIVNQRYILHMSPQYGELRSTSGCDRFVSLGHPCKFQRVSHIGSVTARHSSVGRQPNFAALNRGRHLYSAGWPSRGALALTSSFFLDCRVSLMGWVGSDKNFCELRWEQKFWVGLVSKSDRRPTLSHYT